MGVPDAAAQQGHVGHHRLDETVVGASQHLAVQRLRHPPAGILLGVDQGRPLDAHIPDHAAHAVGIHIVGGAGDQHHAEYRGGAAKPQQDQVGLLEKIRQDGFQSVPHGAVSSLWCRICQLEYTTNQQGCKRRKNLFTDRSKCDILS